MSSYSSKSLRAVHVLAVPGGEAAGPTYTVSRLCSSLSRAGVDAALLSVGPPKEECDRGYRHACFAPAWSATPVLRKLRYSPELSQELWKVATSADVIHSHGLWSLPTLQAGWAANRARRRFIVAPRGMLGAAALQFSRIKKRIFWHILQRQVLEGAACLHATSEQEYLEIRAMRLRNPVAIVKNGVDLPDLILRTDRPDGLRTVLYLGRLHPKKGLDTLIRAWTRVEENYPNWRLKIVGPSEQGYGEKLRMAARAEGLRRVVFEGPLFGIQKTKAYLSADVYVLPTLNDNFAMTVAEALAAEVPVIASKGSPWAGLTVQRCGWWINHGVEPLTDALVQAMNTPYQELRAMGARGRSWMARDFSWDSIGLMMLEVYDWLIHGAAPPTFVEYQ